MPTVLPLTDPRPGAEVTWTLEATRVLDIKLCLVAPNTFFSFLWEAGAESLQSTFLLCHLVPCQALSWARGAGGSLQGWGSGEGTCSCQLVCCSWLSPNNRFLPQHPAGSRSDYSWFPALFCTPTTCLTMPLHRSQATCSAPCLWGHSVETSCEFQRHHTRGTMPLL